ncbi:hypothetical protein [Duncaniella dubosii]|uniref:hypothetical protein n=1 Tax=Duncaniella dubosii TaxID=2518971 RepID=UPI003F669E98
MKSLFPPHRRHLESDRPPFTYEEYDRAGTHILSRAAFTGRSGYIAQSDHRGSGYRELLHTPHVKSISADDREVVWAIDFHRIVSKFGHSMFILRGLRPLRAKRTVAW